MTSKEHTMSFADAPIRTVTLERRRMHGVCVKQVKAVADLRWEAPDHVSRLNAVEHRLIHDVYVEPLQKATVEYPADWWQAVRARWFPAWALRRWPARMVRIEMDAAAYVPEIRSVYPDYYTVSVLNVHEEYWLLGGPGVRQGKAQ